MVGLGGGEFKEGSCMFLIWDEENFMIAPACVVLIGVVTRMSRGRQEFQEGTCMVLIGAIRISRSPCMVLIEVSL